MDCGFQLHVSPSPAFQIDLNAEEFKMEPFEPSVRIIEINAGARAGSGLELTPGH